MNIIHEIPTEEKVIAFTFDDGPNPLYTPQLLEIFEDAAGKATFFMIGEHMNAHPEIVKEVFKRGHEIGNHTFTHPFLTQLSDSERQKELENSIEITFELTGIRPNTFRPPYLDYNENVVRLVKSQGYNTMIGAVNMEARDWEQPGVKHIVESTRLQIRNGSILLFHDGFGDRTDSIEAVRELVTEVVEKGFKLVTVSQLLRKT